MNPDQIDALFSTRFVIICVTFSSLAMVAIIVMLVWATRRRQFTDQHRARRLALEAKIPPE
ncbi:MAG: hypothetical protein FWE88_00735 [Phycisphaerae bacterium]|nr:hypothetical protein [Phycisphaerae bacterium]